MKGSRPLTEAEVQTISRSFTGVFAPRNQALFMVGHRTGFRISELLSLTVGDVQANGKVMERITVSRRHMKGKASGRTVPLHAEARAALSVWLEVLQKRLKGHLDPLTPVFCSLVKDPSTGLRRAISREQGWRILHDAFAAHGLEGKLGTHAMRKTFCDRVYEALRHDLVKTQRAMGNANINSTVQYLSFREEDITDAILGVRMVA